MRFTRSLLAGLLVPVLAVAVLGCEGSGQTATPTINPCPGCVSVDINGAAGGSVTPAPNWPKAAPADIPAFPGHLDSVVAQRRQDTGGLLGVRMIFSKVPQSDFWTYLAELRGMGYRTQGLVYYSAGQSQSDAQARANKGDFDAVKASKLSRVLTITLPTGSNLQVTYDIDGLTQAESDALPSS